MTRYEKALVLCVALLIGQSVGAKVMGRAEGRFFPVIENAQIVIDNEKSIADTVTQFSGKSVKVRPCEFQRIFWRIGRPNDDSSPAQLTILETDKVRPEGSFEFGPWIVRMNTGDLLYNSHSYAVHRCHPLWETVSEFYTPPPNPESTETSN